MRQPCYDILTNMLKLFPYLWVLKYSYPKRSATFSQLTSFQKASMKAARLFR